MKKTLLISLALILLFQCVTSQQPVETFTTLIGGQNVTQSVYYHTQVLDHFNPNDFRVWEQRYAVYDHEFNPLNGTVFIYIGGEGRQKGLSPGLGWMVKLAKKFSAMFIAVEHRFYGASQPFGQNDDSYSIENLQYLTVDQALEDLAQLIGNFKSLKLHGVSSHNPFITIGGSYPGAMSAWFRSKYPHLVAGALASSAVILPIEDFQQYDYQIYLSTLRSGEWCPKNIQKFNKRIENSLLAENQESKQIRLLFNATHLTTNELLSYFGDMWAGMVQYGRRTLLCSFFPKNSTFADQLKNVYNYAAVYQTVDGYDTISLRNTVYNENSIMRQWVWQTCTQFGWFQSANQIQPMRSYRIDFEFYREVCRIAFDDAHHAPDTTSVNNRFGGLSIGATNIVFTNGIEDEWQWASLRKSTPQLESIFSDCEDCGHCVEFRTPKPTDPPGLQLTRTRVEAIFSQWIQDHFKKTDPFTRRMLRKKN